jgi:multidrug efflux pump subunit AcrA (membrane-fusion protein)
VLVKLDNHGQLVEVRAPISGHIRAIEVQPGADVSKGAQLAVLNPGDNQVWEALRALYLIGLPDDLPDVDRYARGVEGMPREIQQQAMETSRAIRSRQP